MSHVERTPERDIARARKRLDELDRQIVRILKERVSFSALVQSARIAEGGCRTDNRRENVVVSRYHRSLGPAGRDIALSLLRLCRGRDPVPLTAYGGPPTRRAFLGPAASVSQQAAELLEPVAARELVPLDTLDDVMGGLVSGRAEEAVLPLENSLSGPVHDSIRALAASDEVCVTGQLRIAVDWVLAAAPGTRLADVVTVASHPHALAQTRKWLTSLLPRTTTKGVASTSASAAGLRAPDAPYEAAVCTRRAAEHYRLNVLAAPDVSQIPVTRFALVRHAAALPAPSGNDVTSLAVTVPTRSLTDVVECLARTHAEVLGLHTLPAGKAGHLLWLDCRGHATDPGMVRTWAELREPCDQLRMIGTYPAGGAAEPSPHRLETP
ncbi:chorismate mutase [Streptomyces sp. NPDC041068]|uniref:chorismate mutase n=1 Tax=Streptomyces sp. NPDC041068 TaxID=3155130 RepID=UPI0033ED2CF9